MRIGASREPEPRDRRALRAAWGRFVGPEATSLNHAVTGVSTVLGAAAAGMIARRRAASRAGAATAALLAADLIGGAYVNNTRASARWYERPGQGHREHLSFAACHIHPAVVAWLDRHDSHDSHDRHDDADSAVPRRSGLSAAGWAAAHYTYLLTSTVLIRRMPRWRRPLGVGLTLGGVMLDRVIGPSARLPWFGWSYYPKLLMGHAGASLWSDAQLRLRADGARLKPCHRR